MSKISCFYHFSSSFLESKGVTEVSETLPAEDDVVLPDESDVAGASSALPTVSSELSCVGPPEQVWHVVIFILIFYINTQKNTTSSSSQ